MDPSYKFLLLNQQGSYHLKKKKRKKKNNCILSLKNSNIFILPYSMRLKHAKLVTSELFPVTVKAQKTNKKTNKTKAKSYGYEAEKPITVNRKVKIIK